MIDDARQQYRIVPWLERPALSNEAERQSTPGVTRTIDGIKCGAVPVLDSAGKIVGKDFSLDHGITVRSEMDVLSPQTGAVIGLVVEELTEIRIGAEPDPGAFTTRTSTAFASSERLPSWQAPIPRRQLETPKLS